MYYITYLYKMFILTFCAIFQLFFKGVIERVYIYCYILHIVCEQSFHILFYCPLRYHGKESRDCIFKMLWMIFLSL